MAAEETKPEGQPTEKPQDSVPVNEEKPPATQAKAPPKKKMRIEVGVIAGFFAGVVVLIVVLAYFFFKVLKKDDRGGEAGEGRLEPPKIRLVQPQALKKKSLPKASPSTAPAPDPIHVKSPASSSAVERELARILPSGIILKQVNYEDITLTYLGKPALGKQLILNGVVPGNPDGASSLFHQFRQKLGGLTLMQNISEGVVERTVLWRPEEKQLVFSLGIVFKPGYGLKKFNGMPSLLADEKDRGGAAAYAGQSSRTSLSENDILQAMAAQKFKKTSAQTAADGSLVMRTSAGNFKQGDSFSVKVKGKKYLVKIIRLTPKNFTLQTGKTTFTKKHTP